MIAHKEKYFNYLYFCENCHFFGFAQKNVASKKIFDKF